MVVHRVAEPADVPALLELFERTKPVIARLAHPIAYRAVIAEALAHRRSLIVVSESDRRLVAYAIIAWDWHRFRAGLVLRHPRVALLMAASLRRRRRRARAATAERTAPAPAPAAAAPQAAPRAAAPAPAKADPRTPSWGDGGPTIAKVIYTAVDPALRGRGIGTGLKAFYVDHLRRSGFRRVDAMLSTANTASVALQRASGWVTRSQGAHAFSYLDLDADREPGA